MARRRNATRTITRYVKRPTRRKGKGISAKNLAKKAAFGTVAGLAVSIPLTLAARYVNQPALMELGQRGGAIAATALGGTPGEAGYQIADAVFDRFVAVGGQGVSGNSGQVYL